MEIVPLTRDLYEEWDKFCMESDDAWFWHTSDWLEYTLHLRPEFESRQKSFLIVDNKVPLAICPLVLNTISDEGLKYNMFSFDRDGGILPAFKNSLPSKQREKILKNIFDYIDKTASELDVKKCVFRCSPLASSYLKKHQYNYLMKFGFLDTTLNTQVLDLAKDLNQILNEMRRDTKRRLLDGEKVFEVNVFDKGNITKETFDQYRVLHHKAAGRVTRPLITFEMMHRWIQRGKAILCGASYNGKYVSFALINIYKDGAYYSSASDDPDAGTSVPSSHVIQWRVIDWLKKNGFRIYETGLQQFSPQLFNIPSEKDITISAFKRGFGGFTVPVFKGEKFYSKELLLKTLSDRFEKFGNAFLSIK